jgi:hypothetical protein
VSANRVGTSAAASPDGPNACLAMALESPCDSAYGSTPLVGGGKVLERA